VELPQPLPSNSTAAASIKTSLCPTDIAASTDETAFVAQSSRSQITVVSPPVEVPTSRPPSVREGGVEQTASSLIVHDGHGAQVALPIDTDLHIVPQEPSSWTRSPCGSYDNTRSPTQSPIVSPDVIYDSYDSPLRRAHDPRSPTYVYTTQVISPTSSCLRLIPQDSSRPTSSTCGSYINDQPPVQSPFFRIDAQNSPRMAGDPRSPRSVYDAPPTSPNLHLTPPPLTGSLCGSYVGRKLAPRSPYVRANVRNVEYDYSPSTPDDPRSPRYSTVPDLSRPGIQDYRTLLRAK
jgi:hypothetical protein